MKIYISVLFLIILSVSSYAAEYCTGTVLRSDCTPEPADVYLYCWCDIYEEYMYVDHNRTDANGFFSICLEGRQRPIMNWKIVAVLDIGPVLTEYRGIPWGSFEINFVYYPGDDD